MKIAVDFALKRVRIFAELLAAYILSAKLNRDTVLRTVRDAWLFAKGTNCKYRALSTGWKPVLRLRLQFPGKRARPNIDS